ncbi:MAG: biotin carboxylase N-terminal domain-containing protein [Planctomycetota bacterium]|jgi:acetyl-CoA carboxylase biotin carboxylase subunit|nr:biotin carboxylase N-terminal domain-containing protein [Planctomycetota bacterium]
MFRRIFIANRGEVAARMVRACRDLGIEAVCGVSEADAAAQYSYLKEAAEVVCLGPSPAKDSYLHMERVIQAAKQTHCSAIHPGWGFLAENAAFAALCKQHGLVFIGPSPSVMDQMGLKLPARAAARKVGLPVVPGSLCALAHADEAVQVAEEVGYPVALKADAGGGGRGIRRCENEADVRTAFVEASREAASAFGNATLYLEKYLEGGRHIEFQVFGDGRGNAVHLFERECSVQRRHQKLIEESPSPAITQEQREHYGELSAKATAAWHYSGAGTMEFLMAPSGKLFFLEMNTRLQVEHPVTELVTGTDLAQAQIQVAAGQALPWSQDELVLHGHAIEARINAEDSEDNFRPCPGTLEEFSVQGEGVRVDTHLTGGDAISPHYDSLIAKVIAHGESRDDAISKLDTALEKATIVGVPTTSPLHRKVLNHDDFRKGEYDTLWLSREF